GGGEPGGDLARGGLVPDGRQQHRELVAAEPRDEVAGADAVGEAVRDELEEPVPDRVPEGVVDLLEAVQVEEEQPGAVARRLAPAAAGRPDPRVRAAPGSAPLRPARLGEGLLGPDD